MENESYIDRSSDISIDPTVDADGISSYNAQRLKKDAKTLCFAPSSNLYFGRDGSVFCCCHNRDHAVGKYPDNTIDEIWNGAPITELRQYLSNYNLSLGCQHCQKDFDRCSFSQVAANHFDELPIIKGYPSMMEFELDSTCNLECSMCNGDLSSSIRKNRDHLPPIISKYDETFVEQLKPYLPHLTETRFSGGEPFLIPIYYQIWEELVKVNPQCLISVQTNGTILNNKVESQLEKGRFEIGVSLDSIVKETFEEIRKNAKFENVMKNVQYFSEYCQRKGTAFRLSICVMRNNWQDLPGYIDQCNKLNAYASFHRVMVPASLSLYSWNSEKLHEVHDCLSQESWNPKNNLERTNVEHYNDYVLLIEKWMKDRLEYEKKKNERGAASLKELQLLFSKAMNKYVATTNFDAARSVAKIEANLLEVSESLSEQQKKELIHQLLYYDEATVFNKFLLTDIQRLKAEIKDHIPM